MLDPRFKDLDWVDEAHRHKPYIALLNLHHDDGCALEHPEAPARAPGPAAPLDGEGGGERHGNGVFEMLPVEDDGLGDLLQGEEAAPDQEAPAVAEQAAAPPQPAGVPAAGAGRGVKRPRFEMPKGAGKKRPLEKKCAFWAEVERYKEMDPAEGDPLQWWKKHAPLFPILSQLARKYLCIPSSSAPTERVFSHVNIVISKRRARTSTDRGTQIVYLKLNKDFAE